MKLLIFIGCLITSMSNIVLGAYNELRDLNCGCSTLFIIMSQPNPYHRKLADLLKIEVQLQLLALNVTHSKVFISPTDLGDRFGYWTMFPVMQQLIGYDNYSWVFLMEENTMFNADLLLKLLRKHHRHKSEFVGYALSDYASTIIHHFDDPAQSPTYPHTASGIALSHRLVVKLVNRWMVVKNIGLDFSIDAKYELAKFLYDECGKVKLIHDDSFCLAKTHKDCATWVAKTFPDCEPTVSKENVFFAIKTCKKFHEDRIPVVKGTWLGHTNRAMFFSDTNDPNIPTVALPVENVSHGHCQKTMAIMKYFRDHHLPEEKWLVISDDDTLFSVPRLLRMLSCYNATEPMVLGERYGYGNVIEEGYDYLTGGAGMVFSGPAVLEFADDCICPTIYSPDDMIIGMCLKRFEIPVTHSPHFHQARPYDYNELYLEYYQPVSFHKHWKVDPFEVYETYLLDPEPQDAHTEL